MASHRKYLQLVHASITSQEIIDLLTELNQQGTTIAIVTHDANVAAQTKRVIHMQDGAIVETAKC